MWVLRNAKWVFWSQNPIGNMLFEMLESLAEQKVIEENEDGQYRYNPQFVPPWTSKET